jgi:[DsrC]-trisulfide reductase subunit J
MRDRIWIVAGLAIFAALITAPFWRARRGVDLTKLPVLRLPANQTQCVAPVSYMRAAHMQLLLEWRTDVVRLGERRYVAFNGKVYQRSLTGTCLGCHNKEQFCDRCHSYVGVSGPYCWNCHNQPQAGAAAASVGAVQPPAEAPPRAPSSPDRLLSRKSGPPSSPFPRRVQ